MLIYWLPGQLRGSKKAFVVDFAPVFNVEDMKPHQNINAWLLKNASFHSNSSGRIRPLLNKCTAKQRLSIVKKYMDQRERNNVINKALNQTMILKNQTRAAIRSLKTSKSGQPATEDFKKYLKIVETNFNNLKMSLRTR